MHNLWLIADLSYQNPYCGGGGGGT